MSRARLTKYVDSVSAAYDRAQAKIDKRAAMKRARRDDFGPVNYMADANGYVMVRRPGSVPFVLAERKWLELELLK